MGKNNGRSGSQCDEKAARLAEALRQNLRRRKAQERARAERGGTGKHGAAPERDKG